MDDYHSDRKSTTRRFDGRTGRGAAGPRRPDHEVSIGEDSVASLRRFALRSRPFEACGLLVGTITSGGRAVVTEVTSGANLARSPVRFVLDPTHLLQVEEDALSRGLVVIGDWHSHPARSARPSERDLADALPGWWHLIVGCDGSVAAWWRNARGEVRVRDL